MKKSRAFSMIELMIVLCIIAALISIILPAIHAVRTRAKATQCLSTMRNLGQAFVTYANNYGGWIPREGDPHPWNFDLFKPWPIVLNPEWAELPPRELNRAVLTRQREVMCPAQPFPELMVVSYDVNAFAFSNKYPLPGKMLPCETAGPTKLVQIQRPSEVILLMDTREIDTVMVDRLTGEHLPEPTVDNLVTNFWPGYWEIWNIYMLPKPLGNISLEKKYNHRRNECNVLMFDGSAKSIRTSEMTLKMWDDGIRSHPNRRMVPRQPPPGASPVDPGY
jgi:prepilin-type N-terminal cleavage/methylation domain-containing protein/prepilin-type processing-associated H-X9-DG protein